MLGPRWVERPPPRRSEGERPVPCHVSVLLSHALSVHRNSVVPYAMIPYPPRYSAHPTKDFIRFLSECCSLDAFADQVDQPQELNCRDHAKADCHDDDQRLRDSQAVGLVDGHGILNRGLTRLTKRPRLTILLWRGGLDWYRTTACATFPRSATPLIHFAAATLDTGCAAGAGG